MISSIYFQTLSLVYMLLLMIVVFSKQRLKSIENSLFVSLIFINLTGLVLDVSSTYLAYVDINNQFLNPLCKVYLLYLICQCLVFTVYVIFVSLVDKDAQIEIKKSIVRKILIIISIMFILISVVIFLIPLYNVSQNGIIYTTGPGANLTYAIVGLFTLIWIISLLINYKNIKDKKYLPIFVLIICIITAALLQRRNPELLIVTSMCCFVVYIMYFTIENPDIKLINELNIAKDMAEKANNSKTDFLSSMSHEIRTPLNAIVGFSQVLLTKDLPAESKSDIEDIVMASDTLLGIVNGILDISKIEANKLEIIYNEYHPKKIIDELIALTKARMGDKPLDFRTYFDPAMPDYLYGDSSRVKQVILNILTNSVKYTKEGYIDFRISVVIKDQICRLIISVEDSGVGIKEADINKLFKKFERLNEGGSTSIEGTGLGLAITKKLVEMMGGKIFVQSIYGRGSKFTVALDQRIIQTPKEIKEETNDYTQIIETIDFSSKKVLVVDDNTLNLKVAQRLLNAYGIQVDIIESGFGLIEKMEAGEVYDLILLDDMMPKLSGTETLEKLRTSPDFKIPTIALTANAIEGMREKYLSLGFDDYLAKPIDKKELNRVIIKYLYKNKE
ncbi:MAG: ATP-binding protein [Bacilli bacterium]|nr:ATP-binding protein [Bacilli bacterium]